MVDVMFPDGVTVLSLLPFVMVAIGAFLQMTTGVGLGLIAGPFLLLVMEASSAIQTAIFLNLLLSVIILPSEIRLVDRAALKRLTVWACLGIPFGAVFLITVDSAILKLTSGIVVLTAALWSRFAAHSAANPGKPRQLLSIGGAVSGVMTGALAIPGPVALWALLSSGAEPRTIRATLRAFFVLAYSAAFLAHYLLTGIAGKMLAVSTMLSPAVLFGMALGLSVRHRVSDNMLGRVLEIVLYLMGASLITKGVWDM